MSAANSAGAALSTFSFSMVKSPSLVDILKISSPSVSMPWGVSGTMVRMEGTEEIMEMKEV
eukprot:scaffold48176_cov30-Tisochrysis_lutea.AAC.2